MVGKLNGDVGLLPGRSIFTVVNDEGFVSGASLGDKHVIDRGVLPFPCVSFEIVPKIGRKIEIGTDFDEDLAF